MSDDHDQPDDLEPPDFSEQFEISVSVRPRHARRGASSVLPALPAPEPPRAPLPPPASPFPDPIPLIMPHGSMSTLSGASGVGKTALTAGWIRCWQTGEPICGHAINRPTAIGMLAVDRPWRDHAQWFAKAGCAPFNYYALRDDPQFDWNQFRDWKNAVRLFTQAVDRVELPPGALLIVDPLPLFIPGRLIDYKDVAIGLALLDKEIQARQLTMLGVFHVAKQKANKNDRYLRPQDRILGSGGQIGYSETAMYLLSPDEAGTEHYEVGWIPHQAKAEAFRFKRDDTGLFVPYDDLDAVADLETALAAAFPDELIHTSSIAQAAIERACQCGASAAKSVLQRLVFQARIVRVARGRYRRAMVGEVVKHARGGDDD